MKSELIFMYNVDKDEFKKSNIFIAHNKHLFNRQRNLIINGHEYRFLDLYKYVVL